MHKKCTQYTAMLLHTNYTNVSDTMTIRLLNLNSVANSFSE